MEFFDRDNEIVKLREIRELSQRFAQFTVLTGRWRIGKTSLVMKAYEDKPLLYFFLCREAVKVSFAGSTLRNWLLSLAFPFWDGWNVSPTCFNM